MIIDDGWPALLHAKLLAVGGIIAGLCLLKRFLRLPLVAESKRRVLRVTLLVGLLLAVTAVLSPWGNLTFWPLAVSGLVLIIVASRIG